MNIQGGPKVGIQYIVHYFWPTLYVHGDQLSIIYRREDAR